MVTDSDKTPRLYLDATINADTPVSLPPEQSHYLTNVMRFESGATLRVFNAGQGEWQATVTKAHKKQTIVVPVSQCRRPEKTQDIHLFCAPIKKTYFDYMLMKATELGVSHIHPLLTARTQIREVNLERCRTIAVEAAEQCERLTVPSIMPTRSLQASAKNYPAGLVPLICAEFGIALPVAEALEPFRAESAKVAIFVGPEGGFTAKELEIMTTLPRAVAVRLGPRILRADTAAIAALTCWQSLCGDWLKPTNDVDIADV